MKTAIFSLTILLCVTYISTNDAMDRPMVQKARAFEELKIKKATLRKKAKEAEDTIIDIPYQEWTQKEKERHTLKQTDEDFVQLAKDIEKTSTELDRYLKTLSPQERAEFDKTVQHIEKIQNMDPAVLERFLTNQMSPEEMDQVLGITEAKSAIKEEKPKKEKLKEE